MIELFQSSPWLRVLALVLLIAFIIAISVSYQTYKLEGSRAGLKLLAIVILAPIWIPLGLLLGFLLLPVIVGFGVEEYATKHSSFDKNIDTVLSLLSAAIAAVIFILLSQWLAPNSIYGSVLYWDGILILAGSMIVMFVIAVREQYSFIPSVGIAVALIGQALDYWLFPHRTLNLTSRALITASVLSLLLISLLKRPYLGRLIREVRRPRRIDVVIQAARGRPRRRVSEVKWEEDHFDEPELVAEPQTRPPASVFSIAVVIGAVCLTAAEALPGEVSGATGFVLGFSVSFLLLSAALLASDSRAAKTALRDR